MRTSCNSLNICREFSKWSKTQEDYAQAFKFLEDRSVDGGDCLYGCIWDMAILEFSMSLHTRRGEAARRRQALHCIWQLELNTNNDEEIIKEAANVRKAMFFRCLSKQLFWYIPSLILSTIDCFNSRRWTLPSEKIFPVSPPSQSKELTLPWRSWRKGWGQPSWESRPRPSSGSHQSIDQSGYMHPDFDPFLCSLLRELRRS